MINPPAASAKRKRKGGGHRTRAFRPHPWPKCHREGCWHRVPPECICGVCGRAYQPRFGVALPHTHQGGTPCCPGACTRSDECGRCADRCPLECSECGVCADYCRCTKQR